MKKRLFKRGLLCLAAALAVLLATSMEMSEHCRGDVNCDSKVNVNDVTSMIKYLLTDNYPQTAIWLYDINGDGFFNISDVTALIDYLLTDEWKWSEPVPPLPDNADVFTVNGVSFAMIHVEGGTFMMGNNEELNSRPVHQVTLSSYWIGETEVTSELWYAVMGGYSMYITTRGLQPVAYLNWDNCQEFITRLNELTGMEFHLPTEAQWEFAARGGNLSHGYKYAGSDDINDVGWYNGNTPLGSSWHPYIKTKLPNELGLYDMSGGIAEFCLDGWSATYESPDPATDPLFYWEPVILVVRRGGNNSSSDDMCTVTRRDFCEHGDNFAGLRLALGGVYSN